MKKVTIIGGGVWGTALALTAARADCHVMIWAREAEVVSAINGSGVNKMFLPDFPLPEAIKATSDMKEALDFADLVLMTTSAQYNRPVFEQMKPFIRPCNRILLCAKGIEETTGLLLSEVLQDVIPDVPFAVLSGPGFAREVALQRPTATTIACTDIDCANEISHILSTKHFRPYSSTDIISPQIGGSVKNVLAIASGIVDGANLGENARAALITRGLNEMIRLSRALGGSSKTMMGMCGLGDLVLTATCTQSRNFSFGFQIGQCGSAKDVLDRNTKTVEGIKTASAVLKRANALDIDMPICKVVDDILFHDLTIDNAIELLLSRPLREEGF